MRSAAPPSTRACGSGSHPPRHTFDGDALRVPGGASAESGPRLGVDTGAATCVGTPPRGPACQSPRVPAIESPTIDGSATGADNGRVTSDNFHLGDYRPRVLDGQLGEALGAAGAVVIEGPRACGKTETARRAAASEIRMDTPDAHQAFAVDADLVLAGDTPRLIDEWQEVPDLWNLVRHAVDDRRAPGQFILTGSSVPRDDERRHSGAGRFIRLRMRPMSLMESGHSAATVSLARVLVGERVAAPDPGLRVGDLAERIVVGGEPTPWQKDIIEANIACIHAACAAARPGASCRWRRGRSPRRSSRRPSPNRRQPNRCRRRRHHSPTPVSQWWSGRRYRMWAVVRPKPLTCLRKSSDTAPCETEPCETIRVLHCIGR